MLISRVVFELKKRTHTMSFACLAQVPAEDGALLDLVVLFGHVRETSYGRFYDVKAVADPINLAYTGLGLPVHTDKPYRDPLPGLQILHCLHSDTEGGDSVLCDGFAVADWLRTEHPDAFELLSRTPVPLRFRDAHSDLRNRAPLIELDAEDRLSTVRYNNRSVDTAAMAMDDLGRFHDAYCLFAAALQDARWQIQFKMGSGDLFMVDNRRVLHGRTGLPRGTNPPPAGRLRGPERPAQPAADSGAIRAAMNLRLPSPALCIS
jgi:gamma-butyrobetaine dioxygenase